VRAAQLEHKSQLPLNGNALCSVVDCFKFSFELIRATVQRLAALPCSQFFDYFLALAEGGIL